MKKVANTTQLTILSFLILIFIGAVLLNLPISNIAPHNFIDSLFTSSASVCVAGLSTIAPASQFTKFGEIVVLILMQIGALGFIFVSSAIFLILKRKLSFKDTINIGTALGTPEDLKNIRPLIKRILRFTLIAELLGTVALSFRFVPMFGVKEGLWQALFTSVSSFCNCGFDILGNNSLIDYGTNCDYLVLGVVAVLTMMGSLGFIVWNEIYDKIKYKKKNHISNKKLWLTFGVHTKIVLIMLLVMIVFGTVTFYAIEKDNSLTIGNYGTFDKLFISMFHGVSARTTGMAAFKLSDMTNAGKLFTMILMIIGGAPGGTAGGLKTVTIVVLLLTTISYVSGNKKVNVFKREITSEIIRQAITVLITAILIVLLCTMIIMIQNPEIAFMDILFEVISAIATCGYSLGITTSLTLVSKVIIIVLMFIGRVSTVTMTVAIAGKKFKENKLINYPKADIKL